MERRTFLHALTATGAAAALGSGWAMLGSGPAGATSSPYGPLGAVDGSGLALPGGFTSRIVATSGEPVAATGHVWHADPDGGATFPTPGGGWIYVSNSESPGTRGGAGAIEFAPDGAIVGARSILAGTDRNCAGGPTPWGTWLSCEERATGLVWECDPTGARAAVAHPAMGRMWHEAAAVDPDAGIVYLTEDQPVAGLYRYLPDAYPDLSTGRLQVLADGDGLVWTDVPDPSASGAATRHQVPGMRAFAGGEGAWFHDGILWFATKHDGRVWRLDPGAGDLHVVYDRASASNELRGGDNVTVAGSSGDVFLAEDGGNMEVCLLVPEGAVAFCRLDGVGDSEITGPAFSPDGSRLYFSSQRHPGRTYEVTGPFRGAAGSGTGPVTLLATRLDADRVALEWRGGPGPATVGIERDGSIVAETPDTGAYVDRVDHAGPARYRIVAGGRFSPVVVVI